MIVKIAVLLLLSASLGVSSAFAVLPTPSDSLHFDYLDDANFVSKGNSMITDQENPSLKLNGIGDYLILDSSLPKKLNDFSISVWIKPDFKVGAPATLSIVSESHAFDLSINNDKINKNTLTFSVFDGIKWHHVESKSEIKDTWTHLAATYSDETISIFVNGVEENSVKVDGKYSLTHTLGKASQHSNDHIKSKSKILIGAFTPLLRADGVVNDNFSGLIDDIGLYDISLSPSIVSELYKKNRIPVFTAPIAKNLAIQETGIPNELGFVASKNNLNNQKIESLAHQGFKISKLYGGILDGASNLNISSDLQETDQSASLSENVKPIVTSTPEHEKTVSVGNSIKKLVRVEPDSTKTMSELPSDNSGIMYTWNLYGLENGNLVDYSDNPYVSFSLIDSNSDGTLDTAEWLVINNVRDFYLISDIL